MVARRLGLFGLSCAALVALTGCPKKHKPPAMTRIWLGAAHACSSLKTGELACWGDNEAGALGERPRGVQPLPAVGLPVAPTLVALGRSHSCGIFDGAVRCWGRVGTGASGEPLVTSTPAPILLDGERALTASAVVASEARTCAIEIATGQVYCWDTSLPKPRPTPLPMVRDVRVEALGLGATRVCAAVASPREVRCSDVHPERIEPTSRSLLQAMEIATITIGGEHACALLRDGSARCWGANESGQLGDGTRDGSREPALVYGVEDLVELAAGRSHTCARTRHNTVACWGANDAFQLSNGTTAPSAKPALVPGLVGVQELVLAGDSACIRMADGGVRCWGKNAHGQLGDGTTEDHPVAMPIKW